MITYFSWWYYQEPVYLWRSVMILTKKMFNNFSITILLRTLFDPWKKDFISVENASLDIRFRVMIDNIVSRFIGFIVRLLTIIIGLILTLTTFVFLSVLFLFWLLVPILILALFINGVRIISNASI